MSEPQDKVDISDLKDTFLECPVCVEHFNQTDRRPRLLHSCLHAFCTQCLNQLLVKEGKDQITCPLCRHVQRVKGKADALPVDPVRNKLVEYTEMKHQKKVLCTHCPDGNHAEGKCEDCRMYLCKDCIFAHKRHHLSRDHEIVTIQKVLEQPLKDFSRGHFCTSHPKHHVEFYCSTDEQLCCISCTVLSHKGHEFEKLEDAAEKGKLEIQEKLKDVYLTQKEMKRSQKQAENQEKAIQKVRKQSLLDINKIFDYLKQQIDQRRDQLLSEVEQRSSTLLSSVKKTSAAHDTSLAIIESTDTYFKQANEKADVVEMLQMFPAIKRSMNSIHGPPAAQEKQTMAKFRYSPTHVQAFDAIISDLGTANDEQVPGQNKVTLFTGSVVDALKNMTQQGISPPLQVIIVDNKQGVVDELAKKLHDFCVATNIEDCPICFGTPTHPVALKCGHVFCKACIDAAFKVKKVCPTCKAVCGVITGNMPEGTMTEKKDGSSLPGYEGRKTIVITYSFPLGTQTHEHPNPGKPYKGTQRVACLPDTPEGRKVIGLLKVAFERRLTFTVGRSVTIGGEGDSVTWNEIHHKTRILGGPTNRGYPDPDYLKRVQEELAAQGVTEADLGATGLAM